MVKQGQFFDAVSLTKNDIINKLTLDLKSILLTVFMLSFQ